VDRVYHTQNNNHLDRNIGSNRHKLSLLVNNNSAEYNAFFKETQYDGAVYIKETISDSAAGIKSQLVGHYFLKQARNLVSD